MKVESLADLFHFLKVSCGTGQEAGTLVALLSFASSLYQKLIFDREKFFLSE